MDERETNFTLRNLVSGGVEASACFSGKERSLGRKRTLVFPLLNARLLQGSHT